MSSSGEEQIPGYDNRGTMIVSDAHVLRRAPVALKDVWDAHWHEIYGRFQHGRGSGYALCLFDDLGNLQATQPLAEPSAGLPSTVTLGRHTECGLHVVGDPCVALRHLMLAIKPGSRSLEIVDLRTDPGFHIDSIGAARGALGASIPITRRRARPSAERYAAASRRLAGRSERSFEHWNDRPDVQRSPSPRPGPRAPR